MEEAKNHKLSNTFRDELAKEAEREDPVKAETERVGEAVMMERDTFVTMRQLQVQKHRSACDREYLRAAIEAYGAFADELTELPVSEGQIGVISMINKQTEALEKQLAASVFAGVNEVTLRALELAVGGSNASKPAVDSDGVGQVAPELTDDDDLDDEDDLNEAI